MPETHQVTTSEAKRVCAGDSLRVQVPLAGADRARGPRRRSSSGARTRSARPNAPNASLLDTLTTPVDTTPVTTVVESDVFQRWLGRLHDYHAVARINARLRRIAAFGHLGDTRAVGDGIEELRVHHGPGYRIYFVHAVATAEWGAALSPGALERWARLPPVEDGATVVVLLCGGDKGSQKRDIKRAKRLAEDWR